MNCAILETGNLWKDWTAERPLPAVAFPRARFSKRSGSRTLRALLFPVRQHTGCSVSATVTEWRN